MFSHPGFYCVVAEQNGRIAGSNCLDERSAIAGIGPITVDPAVQNGGVGRALMDTALDRVRERGRPGVRLVQAAFHNRSLSLYTKLGFDPREEIDRLRPRSRPINTFQFGNQTITTKVQMMVPRESPTTHIDVTAAMNEEPIGHDDVFEEL